MMKLLTVVGLLVLSHTASALVLSARRERTVSMPMHRYVQDCGTNSRLRIDPQAASLLQQHYVPGAGIDKFTPFKKILKDGFMEVACKKDYMYYRGDKFGDNKHDYKLGDLSNVSIVHYEKFVAKEDRVPMTQKVCFEFCRTVPNMGFFGIVNGRGCYCTPYYKSMESDSSQCDAVCEGEQTLMCGGVSKSSIFSMHMCDSTGEDVKASSKKAVDTKKSMDAKVKTVKALSAKMQTMGAALQKKFGAVGDSGATDLMQDAKAFAGKLEYKAKDTEEVATKLGSLSTEINKLKDFTKPDIVTKAERLMEAIDATLARAKDVTEQLDELTALASPSPDKKDAVKQYYPVMYFVDEKFEKMPQTCSGDPVGKPIVGESEDGCASACDANLHSCVGFAYFKDSKTSSCFLFSKFKTGFYYTGCKKAPFEAKCFAKLSKFEGTTLKPNPSGKCEQCFKKVTEADRCY